MAWMDQFDNDAIRIHLLIVMFIGALLGLAGWLWQIQVLRSSEFESSLERQSMRRVRIPASRGRVFDRKGLCLVDNRPSYCITVYVEDLRQSRESNTVNRIDATINEMAAIFGREREVSREDIVRHIRKRRPLPLLAWQDADAAMLARWAEFCSNREGVEISVYPRRVHKQGRMAVHLLGYVGWLDVDSSEPYHYLLPDMEGKSGIERTLNDRLSGVAGGSLIRVDASGFRHAEENVIEPIGGEDVVLTIDGRIQKKMDELLQGFRGAAVLVDPRNGDVLAISSAPSYDPEVIKSVEDYAREITANPQRPEINRAISGLYPPGSTFKPIVALAALYDGRITPVTTENCPGYYMVGNLRFNCWLKTGHGPLALRKGLEQSCNVFFCSIGQLCGYEAIDAMSRQFGLGVKTGIELDGELAGLVPDDAWKRRAMGEGWRKGDTCNLSIGQGALLVTPLQMALATAALANGGTLYRPRLVLHGEAVRKALQLRDLAGEATWPPDVFEEGDAVRRIACRDGDLQRVREGMYDVVESPAGTGKRARVDGFPMAGKTGTAEFGLKAERKKYTWMTVFGPFDAPRYALVMVIEEGESGGLTTAPLVRQLMETIVAMENESRSNLTLGGVAP
jgi:penicillin-binding protein 2